MQVYRMEWGILNTDKKHASVTTCKNNLIHHQCIIMNFVILYCKKLSFSVR